MEAPSGAFALEELVGSEGFVAGGGIVEVVGFVSEVKGAAAARDGALVTAVPVVESVCFSATFPKDPNMLLGAVGAEDAEAPVLAFAGLKRLEVAVALVLDSAGFEVGERRLNAGFDASAGCDVLGNIERPLVLLSELAAADWPPRLGNMGFGASALDCCASDVAGVVGDFALFRFGRLLKRPAVGCDSGLLPKIFELKLFEAALANMLVVGCEVVIFAFASDG